MGKVILDMAMSVDGFIAGPNDDDRGLHTYFFAPAPETTKLIDAGIKTTGAMIMGRRTYDLGDHFDGFADTPYKVPHFVLSHTVPTKPAKGETAFTFVADGIESALRQAKAAAGDRAVVIGGGASVAQQFLAAGLIDELQLYLIPKLLGQGVRLFEQLDDHPLELVQTALVTTPDVTHITFHIG